MAVVKVYTRINWLNKSESLTTPLGKTNLNKMDKAIDTIDNEVVSISATAESLDTTKADRDQLNNMITDIAINDKNGVISITKYNGTVLNIDTAMEKIAVKPTQCKRYQNLVMKGNFQFCSHTIGWFLMAFLNRDNEYLSGKLHWLTLFMMLQNS